MKDNIWFDNYFGLYKKTLFNDKVNKDLILLKKLITESSKQRKKIIFAGNGGSAAMASHCAVDLTKNAGVRAINFNEADLITCFANDFGYDKWVEKAIEFYSDNGDVVVLISSSGNSMNMVNAAKRAKELGVIIVTFTGFKSSNKLKKEGYLNFWVDSKAYNIIEMTHHIWILAVVDSIIGSSEYSA